PGRVPTWPSETGWFTLAVDGPMARTVADVALLLSALAGPDSRAPLALAEPGERVSLPLDRNFKGTRIAWPQGLGVPFEPAVTEAVDQQRQVFEALGCVVEEAEPDFRDADEVFKVWRAWSFELGLAAELRQHRDKLKDTIIWNIEKGAKLTGPQLG